MAFPLPPARARGPLVGAALALSVLAACGDEAPPQRADVAVHVERILLDEEAQSPVVVLVEDEGERRLPIWIGFAEAQSIAARLHDAPALRPNSHDLAKRLLDGLEAHVERVVVSDLDGGIFYARIHLARDGDGRDVVEIDARPSDAIAIALRVEAPLFVSEPLFERAATEEEGASPERRRI